jgi:hypothetical protein
LYFRIFSSAPYFKKFPVYPYSLDWEIKFHTHTTQQIQLYFNFLHFR